MCSSMKAVVWSKGDDNPQNVEALKICLKLLDTVLAACQVQSEDVLSTPDLCLTLGSTAELL